MLLFEEDWLVARIIKIQILSRSSLHLPLKFYLNFLWNRFNDVLETFLRDLANLLFHHAFLCCWCQILTPEYRSQNWDRVVSAVVFCCSCPSASGFIVLCLQRCSAYLAFLRCCCLSIMWIQPDHFPLISVQTTTQCGVSMSCGTQETHINIGSNVHIIQCHS